MFPLLFPEASLLQEVEIHQSYCLLNECLVQLTQLPGDIHIDAHIVMAIRILQGHFHYFMYVEVML